MSSRETLPDKANLMWMWWDARFESSELTPGHNKTTIVTPAVSKFLKMTEPGKLKSMAVNTESLSKC